MEPIAGRGTSLWLVPDAEEADGLRRLIERLASRRGSPAFAPHVTLLPGLVRASDDLAKEAEGLLSELEAMAVALGPPAGHPSPFRSLFLPVAPTFRLVHAQAVFKSAFAPDDEAPFEPHLSLVYGALSPEEKASLAQEIAPELPKRLRLSALEVVRTEGPVAGWRRLARLPLPPSASRPA